MAAPRPRTRAEGAACVASLWTTHDATQRECEEAHRPLVSPMGISLAISPGATGRITCPSPRPNRTRVIRRKATRA